MPTHLLLQLDEAAIDLFSCIRDDLEAGRLGVLDRLAVAFSSCSERLVEATVVEVREELLCSDSIVIMMLLLLALPAEESEVSAAWRQADSVEEFLSGDVHLAIVLGQLGIGARLH